MKKREITEEEWDNLSDDFCARQAGHTSSLSQAMDNIMNYKKQFKIIKKKKELLK